MLQTLLFFVQGVPESVGLVAFCLVLAKVRLRWGVILIVGSLLTIAIYLIRSMPVTFGLHTVTGILLTILFIARTTRVSPSTNFIVVFASNALLALMEVIMYELIGKLSNTEVSQLISNNYTWMLIGLPQAVVMIAIALVIAKYRKPQEGMWKI